MVIHTTQLQHWYYIYRRANQADHLPTNNKQAAIHEVKQKSQ